MRYLEATEQVGVKTIHLSTTTALQKELERFGIQITLAGRYNMRIVLFSDIHGNAIALEAVLTDIARRGHVDEYWVLGDLVALGPEPTRVLELLTALPCARIIRGNTDRYVFSGTDRPSPSMADVLNDTSLMPRLVECAGTFAWTQGVLSSNHWNDWLMALPLEVRTVLPCGTRALGVHASPDRDDGYGLRAGSSREHLRSVVKECNANLIFGGHHHMPLDERVDSFHVVNLGSVSNPYAPDLRASYVNLECDEQGYQVSHYRVDYDRDAVIEQMRALRHPGATYVISHLRGERHFIPNR